MKIQTSDLIEVLGQHIDRKDWNQAIQLLTTLKAADEAQVFTELSQSDRSNSCLGSLMNIWQKSWRT